MRVRLTAAAIFVALLGGYTALLAPSADAESTPSAFGSRLVTLINQARSQHGLHTLTVAGGTSTVATNWTNHMASAGGLSHNPNLGSQLETHGSPNWTTYAENVGDGDTSSADAMFTNYMNSPEHRSNILDPAMRYVGVGVVFAGGFAWNTLDFVDQYNSSSSSTSTTTTTKSSTTTRTTTTRTTTAAPRTTSVTKSVAPRTTVRTSTRVAPVVHHAAARKPAVHPVVHRAAAKVVATHATVTLPVHAAAPAPAPSPVAMATPVTSRGARNALALLAGAMILLVVASRFAIRALLARR